MEVMPVNSLLINKIIEFAEREPAKVAVVEEGGALRTTYGALYAKAQQVARHITALALPAGQFIPVALPTGAHYVAAELGIWLSGHAVVPLGDSFPQDRLAHISAHCEAPFILDTKLLDEFLTPTDATATPVPFREDAVAALFYTSGSTGVPKGVVHTWANLEATFQAQIKVLDFSPQDQFATGSPFYFITQLSALPCLQCGATLHLLNREARSDVHVLEEYVAQESITKLFLNPGVLALYENKAPSLQAVYVVGERLSNIEPKEYAIWNFYGLTETASLALCFQVDRAYANTPIGKPLPHIEACVMDSKGNCLPPGEEGELCLKGPFTVGYYKDPSQTATLWRNGWLHTADVVTQLPNGEYLYVNRKDAMLKINGQRVEPGEVEVILGSLPGVQRAIVKGFTRANGSAYLCAYYVPTPPQSEPSENASSHFEHSLRKALLQKLPAYMVPQFFVRLDALPLNANGKVDRKALQPPVRETTEPTQPNEVSPKSPLTEQLCQAFAAVLQLEHVAPDNDFYQLGGDSIRVMRLQHALRQWALSAKVIYQERTPQRIARWLEEHPHVALPEAPDTPDTPDAATYPLSQTQLGIYAACRAQEGELVYHNPCLYRLDPRVDLERLAQALSATLAAHPQLSAQLFLDPEGEPRLRRTAPGEVPAVETLTQEAFDALRPHLVQPFPLMEHALYSLRILRTEEAGYLFLDVHHLIYDGVSHQIFLEDLNAAYRGEALEPETYTGFDLAREETQWLQTQAYNEAARWYHQHFDQVEINSRPLPDVHPPHKATHSNASTNASPQHYGRIERELTVKGTQLEAFCREAGVTPNVLTTAAFAYVLGVFSNAQEALFATVYHGRSDGRTERTIGMLVKTLPVYLRWDAQTTVHHYLTSCKEFLLGAMHHDLFSFAQVCATNPQVSSDILFAYQDLLPEVTSLAGYPAQTLPLPQNAIGNLLTVQLFREKAPGQPLRLTAQFKAGAYSQEFMDQLLQVYQTVLQGLMTQSQLTRVPLLNKEQEAQLDAFNQTECPYNESLTVIDLFRAQAASHPHRIAIVSQESPQTPLPRPAPQPVLSEWTYARVAQEADAIAWHLVQQGVKRGDVVAVLIPRSHYLITVSLGVLAAGAAYQPLDPTYPSQRLQFMMADAQVNWLITSAALHDQVSEYTGNVLYLHEIDSLPQPPARTGAASQEQVLPRPQPQDGFTLLYTSGTTGKPKGCMLTHHNLAVFCQWYRRFYAMEPHHCVGAYASYGFDAHLMDFYPALTTGARCCIVSEELRLNFPLLQEFLTQNGVTHLFVTTQVGHQIVEELELPTLQHLSMGGEKMVPLTPPANYRIYNLYGPTECTILATAHPMTSYEPEVPIGHAVDNIKLYVTHASGGRLPIGAPGELWVAGPHVAHGYLNRPEQTAKVFIDNPFTQDPKYRRVYRTGDIVRQLSNGNLEFVGRRDGQVKIRGFRIELTEVEDIIRKYPGITNVAVVAPEEQRGGHYLAAYVVSDQPVDVDQLHAFIRQRKPPYMVPEVTLQIDQIPLTQNMKVNKQALPPPHKEEAHRATAAALPLNALEEWLIELIDQTLHVGRIDLTQPLNEWGLTSISSLRLASRLYKRFGITFSGPELLQGATIRTIENAILRHWMECPTQTADTNKLTEAAPTTPSAAPLLYPLSYAQQGVYYECAKRPGDTSYIIPALFSFAPGTDPEALAHATATVMAAHPYLMTHFEERGGEVFQVRATHPVEVSCIHMNEASLSAYKNTFMRPFVLSEGPLYRLAVVSTEQRVALLAGFHHLIFDGISLNLFFKGLKQQLEGADPTHGPAQGTEAPTYSYFDYVLEERRAAGTPAYRMNEAFFDTQLKEMEEPTQLPPNLNGLEDQGLLALCSHPLDGAALRTYCHAHKVTPAALCLAAALYTLSRYVNRTQVYMSILSSGRQDMRTHSLLGMFVKTLPFGMDWATEKEDTAHFVTRVGELLSQTVAHEAYPLAELAHKYHFVPRVMYACQLDVLEPWIVNGECVRVESLELNTPKFPLSIHIETLEEGPHKGTPGIVLQYNNALYSSDYMEGFARAMATVLQTFMQDPQAPLHHVSLVDAQSAQLLERFRNQGIPQEVTEGAASAAPTEVPGADPTESLPPLFHRALEYRARQTPEHTALLCSRRLCETLGTVAQVGPDTGAHSPGPLYRYTYAELEAGANRIAHALIAQGVTPRSRVVLLLPRTGELIMALFGVLKTGSAYIPCDPEYPAQRIRKIVAHSGAKYVISTAHAAAASLETPSVLPIESLLQPQPIEAGETPGAATPLTPPHVDITPQDLAYLIYTSGSTGEPKGVMLRHEGLCNYVRNHPLNRHVHALVQDAHTFLSVTTIAFDMALKEIGTTLWNGLTLVLATEEEANHPLLLAELMTRTQANAFNATPSRLLQYLALPEFCSALARCTVLMCGGERFPSGLLQRLRQITRARLFNTYGPTEITVSSNAKEFTAGRTTEEDPITVGPPLLNYYEFIADPHGNELPPGLVGELYIGGVGVAVGYHGLEALTQERFVLSHGRRMYKTGDLARWTPQGEVEILGRTDEQIKLRGLRIELGEVEQALRTFPGITSAVIQVCRWPSDGEEDPAAPAQEHLCAYYTAADTIEIEALKKHLKAMLPLYMVPTVYLQLAQLPLTPNGKINRKALPLPHAPHIPPAPASESVQPPANATEQCLCTLFARTLGLEGIGSAVVDPTQSFFDLGGTSLMVTRLLVEAHQAGYRLAYGDVFANPTPRALAGLLTAHDAAGAPSAPQVPTTPPPPTVTPAAPTVAPAAHTASENIPLPPDSMEVTDFSQMAITPYPYLTLRPLLEGNTLAHFLEGRRQPIGDVLLTGATGFLGVHLLRELIEQESGKIYCLARSKGQMDAVQRLKTVLFYYFDQAFEEAFAQGRIEVVEGDVTQPKSLEALYHTHIDTVFHCAANVKHFALGTQIEDVNIGGTAHIISFCRHTGARLVHISTVSVGGMSVDGTPPPHTHLNEQMLYFGQYLDNKYIRSKFLSERLVLEQMQLHGLNAKIMRVGNLAARNSDGEFQMNFSTNTFMGRLKSYRLIGKCSFEQLDVPMEFSPIEETAKAILLLSSTPRACCIFHPYNHHYLLTGDIFTQMAQAGYPVEPVEYDQFARAMEAALADPAKSQVLSSILAYQDMAHGQRAAFIRKENAYTMQVLYRLGYRWPTTSWDYVIRFLEALKGLGFFD